MTTQDAVKLLRRYNAWRRFDMDDPSSYPGMPDPKAVGEAIDVVCAALDEQETLRDQIASLRTQRDYLLSAAKRTLDENGHLADGDVCTLIVLKRAVETLEETT